MPVPRFFPLTCSLVSSRLVSSRLVWSLYRAASPRGMIVSWIGAWCWRETRNEQAPHRPHSDTRDRFRARHPVVVATARSSRNRSRDLRPDSDLFTRASQQPATGHPTTERCAVLTDMDSHLCHCPSSARRSTVASNASPTSIQAVYLSRLGFNTFTAGVTRQLLDFEQLKRKSEISRIDQGRLLEYIDINCNTNVEFLEF